MLLIQECLDNIKHLQEEDLVSAMIYLAQLPVDVSQIEKASELMFHITTHLYSQDFHNEFTNALHTICEKNYVGIILQNNVLRVHVHKRFQFKLLFFSSLKYIKTLLRPDSASQVFLQNVIRQILATIQMLVPHSLHLLKFLEMILRKRGDILTADLSILILRTMNRTASSPLPGFKRCVQDVSCSVLKHSLPDLKKQFLHPDDLPTPGIDTQFLLSLLSDKEIREFVHVMNKRILNQFCSNTDSRDASFCYGTLISFFSFEEFLQKIWPCCYHYLQQFDEGEFYQSLLKYWIPRTVRRYEQQFYIFVANKNVDVYLKAHILLETKKKGFYDKSEFDRDAFAFLKYSKTRIPALKMLCTYLKALTCPDEFDVRGVKFYLCEYVQYELSDQVVKTIKQFISQIFLSAHMILMRGLDEPLITHDEFLHFLYEFCITCMREGSNEISAKLLKIVWDVALGSSSDLETCYKIENIYAVRGNLYYQQLEKRRFWNETFRNDALVNRMQQFCAKEFLYCPNLVEIIKNRYMECVNLDDRSNLLTMLDALDRTVCLQSSEKVRIYSELFVTYKEMKGHKYHRDFTTLVGIFQTKIDCGQELFCCVLILDMMLAFVNHDDVDLVPTIEESLLFLERTFDENLHVNLNIKATKVLESFVNNVIGCMLAIKKHWSKFNKTQVLEQMCTIIQKSNLKRPVSMAVTFVQQFGKVMDSDDDDRAIKMKLLDQTLNSLYQSQKGGKIRRNPETRLVIHALCLSNKTLTKPYLVWSLNFMLEVLSNPSTSDCALASTLHSLEVMVSDNAIHDCTLPYIVKITERCIKLFNKTSWIVRNADLQLVKALIERFLGVSLDYNVRPKTVEDLFLLFPPLVVQFRQVLETPFDDSAVIALLFFSESQIRKVGEQSLGDEFHRFRLLLVHIVKKNFHNLSFFAIKALASLCVEDRVPYFYSEIVRYIRVNFIRISANVFANLIKLVQELYHRYECSPSQIHGDVIMSAESCLVNYLKCFDCMYFNLLSLKLHSVEHATKQITAILCGDINYEERIWLNNYVPFVFNTVHLNDLAKVLADLLSHPLPEYLQIQVLTSLVDRCMDNSYVSKSVVNILILKLCKLSDCQNFLIMSYAKVILLLYEIASDLSISDELLLEINQDLHTVSIYKMFVYIMVFAKCTDNAASETFVNRCVKRYHEVLLDVDIVTDLAANIVHLYKCGCIHQRSDILKITFYLLLNRSTSFEIRKFVSSLTSSQCSSLILSLHNLLEFNNLYSCVGDQKLTMKLLIDFYCFIDELPDEYEKSDTYYLIESDFLLPKERIKKIILKSLLSARNKSLSKYI